jgi:cytochrome c2
VSISRAVDSAAVRRAALIILLASFTVGCGSGEEAAPLPETVVGTVEQAGAEGDPEAGAMVFEDAGCAGCHTFEPAGSTADVGPNLDELPQLAERANQGTLEEFTRTSITNPDAYVEEGFQEGVMPAFSGSEQELADLVAFLTQQQQQ